MSEWIFNRFIIMGRHKDVYGFEDEFIGRITKNLDMECPWEDNLEIFVPSDDWQDKRDEKLAEHLTRDVIQAQNSLLLEYKSVTTLNSGISIKWVADVSKKYPDLYIEYNRHSEAFWGVDGLLKNDTMILKRELYDENPEAEYSSLIKLMYPKYFDEFNNSETNNA